MLPRRYPVTTATMEMPFFAERRDQPKYVSRLKARFARRYLSFASPCQHDARMPAADILPKSGATSAPTTAT